MLNIPYISSPENACALACYTMVAKYYFPEITFEDIAKISDWKEGYVVWPFKFWKWILEKGIKVTDYDLINYKDWGKHGSKSLENSMDEKEFKFIKENSTDLEELGKDINVLFENNNFVHKRQKPTFSDLENAFNKGSVCEVILDSYKLDRIKGFAIHRVVITDIDENFITFHDPRLNPRLNRREEKYFFLSCWLGALSDPEICTYSK